MLETYLAEEVAEVQALLMHGRIAKKEQARASAQVLGSWLQGLVPGTTAPSADSEEAMLAQAAAERLLGPPANG